MYIFLNLPFSVSKIVAIISLSLADPEYIMISSEPLVLLVVKTIRFSSPF